ncbi:MAG: hypothetical protein WBO36_12550 [Saprospiraceae bacterium]
MAQTLAVIDLGSNTFHLLIVSVSKGVIDQVLCRKRVFTGLSEGGVEIIHHDSMKFGWATLEEFNGLLGQYHHPKLRVIGTAALRKASNRQEFIDRAQNILNTPIEIIDGQQEAHYIYKGITLLGDMSRGHHLIMDIGGGSTEFIIISEGKKLWSNSYPLGVGVLHAKFHKHEPISTEEIKNLTDHVMTIVSDMVDKIGQYNFDSLAGASGSFEVLQSMSGLDISSDQTCEISIDIFQKIYTSIVYADVRQRKQLSGLPAERVKLIVVGMLLKSIIIELIKPRHITVSPYALKEGVLSEMMD